MALNAPYVVIYPQPCGHLCSKTLSTPSFGRYWKQTIGIAEKRANRNRKIRSLAKLKSFLMEFKHVIIIYVTAKNSWSFVYRLVQICSSWLGLNCIKEAKVTFHRGCNNQEGTLLPYSCTIREGLIIERAHYLVILAEEGSTIREGVLIAKKPSWNFNLPFGPYLSLFLFNWSAERPRSVLTPK